MPISNSSGIDFSEKPPSTCQLSEKGKRMIHNNSEASEGKLFQRDKEKNTTLRIVVTEDRRHEKMSIVVKFFE